MREIEMKNGTEQEKRFEELFRKYYSRLYYYALDWTEEEEAAKDIVSELFGDLWQQREKWTPENEEAYLFRAVHNRCLNYLKRRITERDVLQSYLAEKEAVMGNDLAEHEALMKQVDEAMDRLSPKTRFIVEQCYVEGKKYKELAELLETSAGMIHKHISKALAIFKKLQNEKK